MRVMEVENPQGGLVPTWSYSGLKEFETCNHRTFLAKVERHPQPSSPALDRGTAIHELAEQYVRNELPDRPAELEKLAESFEWLAEMYALDKVELEQDWGFTVDWEPCDWFDDRVWCRQKLDAFVREDETSGIVIDHKTGKKFGNEITHSGQLMQYAVGAFMRYPELEFIKAQIWYLDHGAKLEKSYTRERAMVFLPKINERAITMTSATEFTPNPSKYNCMWCPYRETGVCGWAVD